MIIQRKIAKELAQLAKQFPAVAVMGPRQSGKTTLVKELFPNYKYVTLEDLDRREEAKLDPRMFFATYKNEYGIIIDEIQEAPELFSYMQGIIDEAYKPGYFIVAGSQHFLIHEKISQTLAGRIALLTLLPLSAEELKQSQMLPATVEETIFKGFYPRVYVQPFDIQAWYSQYITTYIERDVRLVINIANIIAFQRFIKLCAARVGNIVNYADLARDCDISPNTAKSWLSILEASYIIKLVYPYYKNFNKRIIKSPKLYFYDTGLVCSLVGIKNSDELFVHPMRGALFESFVFSEIFKYYYNASMRPDIYFWRDVQGHEIDCIIEKSLDVIIPIEIKSGMTISTAFFKNLIEWGKIAHSNTQPYVVYAGTVQVERTHGLVIVWNDIAQMMARILE